MFITGCANSGALDKIDSQNFKNLKSDLAQGKTVIIYKMNNNDETTEQYADWSSNLNDFMRDKSNIYVVYRATADIDNTLKLNNIKPADNYTLFIKNDNSSYFYKGIIVEMMVYMAIDEVYTKNKITPMAEAFLPDIVIFKFK